MSALSELKKSEPADKLVNWQTSNCGFYANMTSQKLLKSTQTPSEQVLMLGEELLTSSQPV